MEENKESVENTDQTSEAFLDGFGGDDTAAEQSTSENSDTQAETDEGPGAAEQNGADGKAEGGSSAESAKSVSVGAPDGAEHSADEAAAEPSAHQAEQKKTWTLRHLDEEKTVDEQEMTALAQKGMDYDRVRTRYDEAKPVMELFSKFAKDNHMTIPQYAAYVRMEAKKASGMDDAAAKQAVELEDREAKLTAAEAEEQGRRDAQEKASQRKQDEEERRKADISEFQTRFPEAAKDPKKIPASVWESVQSGLSLCSAYGDYLNKQKDAKISELQKALEDQKQNEKNSARSTGSMVSAGNESKAEDVFISGFNG